MSVEQSVEWAAGETEVLGENLPQRLFVHHKSYMTWPGLEPGPPHWDVSDYPPMIWHDLLLMFLLFSKFIYFLRPPLWSSGQSSWLLNGDVLCFLWGTNWIYICYVEKSRPSLCSSGQSSWLQIQMSGFDSRRYQIFWEVLGKERSPLSLVSTTEELLGRNSSGSGLENRDYGRRGSVTLTTRHPSIRKSWHLLRQQAVVAQSV
jgi:hypothetical protein